MYFLARISEIGPRIIVVYILMERYCRKDGILMTIDNPDFLLGIFGNFICFVISTAFQLQRKAQFGGCILILYYFIFYAENAVLFSLWAKNESNRNKWFFILSCIIVIGGFIFHILFLGLYYFFRKKKKAIEKQKNNGCGLKTKSIFDNII